MSVGLPWRAAAAALTTVLCGCAAEPKAPPLQDLPALPERWASPLPATAAAADQDDRQPWWSAFGDPGLTQLVETALAANPDVASAVAAVAQARSQQVVARAATTPRLDASASIQSVQSGNGPVDTVFRTGLDASWELDWLGRGALGVRASQADIAASEASLAQVRLTLAAEVALQYFEWWSWRERLRLTGESLARQLEALRLTQWRAQAGLASAQDAASARAAVEQTRASLPVLEASARQAMYALAVLTGRPPGTALPEPPRCAPVVPSAWALPVPADVLRQRPDVAAAEARLRAAYARAQQADAARWPMLRLGGVLSLAAPRVSTLFDVGALTRTLAANLAASVFDGSAAQAQAQVQAAAAQQAQAALAATLLAALREVENALVALASDRERLNRLHEAVAAAEQAEQLASQRYAVGLTDYRTLLDAQRARLALQIDLVAARANWASDHVRLIKALGGGWAPGGAERASPAAAVQP